MNWVLIHAINAVFLFTYRLDVYMRGLKNITKVTITIKIVNYNAKDAELSHR